MQITFKKLTFFVAQVEEKVQTSFVKKEKEKEHKKAKETIDCLIGNDWFESISTLRVKSCPPPRSPAHMRISPELMRI